MQQCEIVSDGLQQYVSSADLEVQDRATSAVELMQVIRSELQDGTDIKQVTTDLSALFAGELNPVALKAQRKVQIPEG